MAMPGVRRIVALVVAVFLLSGVAPLQSEGAAWFVTQNGAGTKHGGSWSNAMGESEFVQTLQLVQPAGTEFWIAKGTYRPTVDPNNRDATFILKNGVALYGGFAGNETQRKERDWNANPTYLSGEIQNDGSILNNSLHVVFAEIGTDGTAVMDGFVITGGNADGGALQDTHGGGMINFGDTRIANCTFLGNRARLGGGLFNQGSASVVTGCTFLQNTAREDGGGMYNTAGNLSIAGCTFYGNIAYSLGGGMKNQGSNPVVESSTFRENMAFFGGGGMSNEECGAVAVNCTFYNNRAGVIGGGMHTRDGSPRVTNCTFYKNTSDLVGGDLGNLGTSSPKIKNTIFWGASIGVIHDHPTASPVLSFCVVQGGYAGGTSIITADPKLADLADNGGRTFTCALLAGSSAIDAGTSDNAPAQDQRGTARPQGSGVDIGAYESSFSAPPSPLSSSGGGCSAAGGSMPIGLLLLLPLLLLRRP